MDLSAFTQMTFKSSCPETHTRDRYIERLYPMKFHADSAGKRPSPPN